MHEYTDKVLRCIDCDEEFVFSAGEGSGKLAVFTVAQDSGRLTRVHTYEVGKSLPWVLAIEVE